uniref:Peptidase_M14 domain-containing protein n=1 Tax=Macrostomum lignano TaxID=282301 RepID=A0A1I8FL99_9PLAT
LGLTFFNYPSHRNVKVDILVPPRLVSAFRKAVAGRPDIQLELLHRNYGRVAAQADRGESAVSARLMKRLRRAVRRSDQLILNHNQYLRYDQLLEAVNSLAQQCNLLRSNTCRQQEIGSAYEGRKLIVLRIEKSQTDKQKRKVWIDGGIHAREWISPATVLLYMADVLISKGLNRRMWTPEVVALLDYYDFLMLPLYNPDGYEYSHSHYDFGAKTAKRTVATRLKAGWGGSGSSSDPCQDNYRGAGPFSAMESAAVKRFVEQENSDKKILLFLSYHSYGQYVLMPFGFKRGAYPRPALSAGKMSCVAFFGSREMFSTNHAILHSRNQRRCLVPYSLTVELPDDGAYGFLLPPAYIRNVWQRGGAGPAGDAAHNSRPGDEHEFLQDPREYDGGILLGRDRIESLQVAQLQRERRLVEDVGGLLQGAGGLLLALSCDHLRSCGRQTDLGSGLSGSLGFSRHGSLKLHRKSDVLAVKH